MSPHALTMLFGAIAQNAAVPMLQWSRAAFDAPGEESAQRAPDSRSNGHDKKWLTASTWTIIAVLALLFCVTLGLGLVELSPRGEAIDFRPYRIPVVLTFAIAELALIAAIAFRDHGRRNAEKLLRESEQGMAMAAGAADIGMWHWDARSDKLWMTDRCRAILAIPRGRDCGLAAITEAAHPDDLPLVSEAMNRARATAAAFDMQFRLTAGGSQIRWVHGRGRPQNGLDGRLVHIAGTLVDITEHKTLQAEIERQRQSLVSLTRVSAIGELSGAMAHELNQPLTAILSNAQAIQRMIRRDPVNMEDLRGAVADIIEDDSRAGDVIRHLHTLLRREDAARAPVDMTGLVQKVIGLVRNELVTRQVLPVIEVPGDAPPVLGDAVQLQQLLLNLILNAMEAICGAGQKNGIVIIAGHVVTNEKESQYHLSVSDTGPGIKNEVMEKLFEPFLSTKKQGLGLGLSISRAIVTGHGGAIRAENNNWGGATFHVFLPLARNRGE